MRDKMFSVYKRTFSIIGIGLWGVCVALLAYPAKDLTFNNDTWLEKDSPRRVHFDNFVDEFEKGESMLIIVELTETFFTDSLWESLYDFGKDLEAVDGVLDVQSPLQAVIIIDTGDALEIRPFQEAYRLGFLADMDAYRQTFNESPYRGRLLSDDERLVVFRLRADVVRNFAKRAHVVDGVRRVIADHHLTEQTYIVGDIALKHALNDATKNNFGKLLLYAALVLLFFLRFACGSWARAVWQWVVAAGVVAVSLGVMQLWDHSMNAVSLALPVMVAVIGIADGLHIMARWDMSGGDINRSDTGAILAQRLALTIEETWRPCLFASLTSAVGFGSFVVSELVPLSHFGMDAFVAILLAYPLIVSALWLWLPLEESFRMGRDGAPSPPQKAPQGIAWDWDAFTERVHRLSERYTRATLTLSMGSVLILVSGLSFLYTETNFLSVFFAESSRIKQGFNKVDDSLGGSGRVDVIVDKGRAEAYREVDAFDDVRRLSERFSVLPHVGNVESYLLPVGMVHRAFAGEDGFPKDDATLSQELLFLEFSRSESTRDVLASYVDFNYEKARLSLQTPDLDSHQLGALIESVRSVSGVDDTEDSESVIVTGFGVFIHTLSDHVLTTQAQSLLLTLSLIGLLLLAQFGLKVGAVGFCANLMPLAATGGLVSWLGYPYDFATILIASLTLGLCVDDTIHLLHHYKKHVSEGRGEAWARHHALRTTIAPIIWTSFLFCCGLAVIGLSELVVMQRFAAFTIFGLFMAIFSSIVFLPALLAWQKKT
ncbi:MAG: MMPL family transporter [Alphaproteobacteria bacterium GM7ARS4]|nr:MMPL family transporter [Alphaproteobacteria bacterium GM7ARS4]